MLGLLVVFACTSASGLNSVRLALLTPPNLGKKIIVDGLLGQRPLFAAKLAAGRKTSNPGLVTVEYHRKKMRRKLDQAEMVARAYATATGKIILLRRVLRCQQVPAH